ncbi:MAG: phosphoribosyltransferase [Candidatus Adlerbacteria bacterium]|nr:phosphoribosyltransferase [Candidatus Adlerbacteria bacterium]
MRQQFYEFFTLLLRLVAPARASEDVIRALTLDELYTLVDHSGILPYHDPRVTALVWEIKYYNNPHAAALAGHLLAENIMAAASESLGKTILIPIPMHSVRRRERGHNQTEVLCKAALEHAGQYVEYAPHALVRARNTPRQQKLPRHERLHNMANTMTVPQYALVRGRSCIVIDDVTTTGATFTEAKRALTVAGAKDVVCIALTHS